jgi:hypothetical protein
MRWWPGTRRETTPGGVRNSRSSGRTDSTASDSLTGLSTEFPVTTILDIEVITPLDSIDSYDSGLVSTRLSGVTTTDGSGKPNRHATARFKPPLAHHDTMTELDGESPSVAAAAGIDEDVLDEPRTLAPGVRLQWLLGSSVGALVLGVMATGIAYITGLATALLPQEIGTAGAVGAVVFVAAGLFGVARAVLLYRSWEYVVRADSLYLSRGVFTRVRTVVPYVRVQHIDTTRSPVERLLGLSTLVVYTAGSRGADVTIPGLTPDRASTLQHRLERLAIESEEADAV